MRYLLILCFLITSVDAQTYRQSYVDPNGNVITNYYYPNLPGQPNRGRPYRENGKIKYQKPPQNYPNYPYYYQNYPY